MRTCGPRCGNWVADRAREFCSEECMLNGDPINPAPAEPEQQAPTCGYRIIESGSDWRCRLLSGHGGVHEVVDASPPAASPPSASPVDASPVDASLRDVDALLERYGLQWARAARWTFAENRLVREYIEAIQTALRAGNVSDALALVEELLK